KEINSLDIDLESTSMTENPGDAVLASGTNNLAMITEIKLNREQVRASNKETLMGIIDNVNITDDQKQDAISELLESTSISEKEAAAEMLLSAKGFSDVVVSITEDSVDVVVNQSELSDAQRAQIEDIVKRKTEVSAEKIVITPILDTK
ncbi:MAG: SpoIIIAH-like family protein, partial [Lachnospiraceae bacterium]|nr:SpoIIIAH-like family protein [Lachnospiraceae bacterium]